METEEDIRKEIETMQKHVEVLNLLSLVNIPPNLLKYFDYESMNNLDEKYRILKEIESGKSIWEADPDNMLLELMPPPDQVWD